MSNLLLLRRRLHIASLAPRLNQVRRYALIGKPSQNQKPIWSLPESPARTRFAPSPTGYLHLGSLRTALFNYLLAQATGGQFILRLEDTDRKRLVDDAESRLYQDMLWAGLNWDEGPDKGGPFGPYKQSERLELYRQHIEMLLEKDRAFRCFCSREDLEFNLQQATSSGAVAHYPGTCMGIPKSESDRRAANGEPHVVRFKTSDVPVSAPDLVYGAYKKAEREDNFIIMKRDGYPTYHFANVVDDHFMEITHVIRGAEWLISTPKHVELYNAFGWQPPNFAHVGLLVDHQRQKLSKRDIDNIGISVFRDTNVIPEALLNFSVLLGWDPSLQNRPHLDKRGRMTLEEMKANFTLKFTRGDIVVDLAKLKFFQTRFTRDLISGAIPDPTSLSHRILKPMKSELERLDREMLKEPVTELVAEVVGDHPKKRIGAARQRKEPTEEYIHQVLKTSKAPMDNHRQFIRENLYTFWPPSTLAYKNSFIEFQSGMNRIKMERGADKILNMDITKVLHLFRASLDMLKEEEWTLENVGNKAKELADSVTYYSTENGTLMDHGAGWKFLRWALLVGSPGLSIVPVMVLLGREETIKRLRVARKCAKVKEEQLAVEAKRAEKLRRQSRLHAKIMGYPRGKGQESLDDQVSEPRNVKVRKRQQESAEIPGKAKGFLRPIHHESHLPEIGPFWSPPRPQPVPDPEPKPEPEPEPETLTPKHISPKEFMTGQRHILVNDQSDPAENKTPRRRRDEKRAKQKAARRSGPADEISPFKPGGSFFAPEAETWNRPGKRVKQKPARRSEPADEISPFEPGGSFFAPEEETRPSFGRPGNTRRQERAHPPDVSSHVPELVHAETPPGSFMQGMSDGERRAHFKLLMDQKADEEARRARGGNQLRASGEPTRRNPTEPRGGTPPGVPGAVGSFFAGKPVLNHPLRIQADGGRPRDVEGERQLQKDIKEWRHTKRARPTPARDTAGPFHIGKPASEHPIRVQAKDEWEQKKVSG